MISFIPYHMYYLLRQHGFLYFHILNVFECFTSKLKYFFSHTGGVTKLKFCFVLSKQTSFVTTIWDESTFFPFFSPVFLTYLPLKDRIIFNSVFKTETQQYTLFQFCSHWKLPDGVYKPVYELLSRVDCNHIWNYFNFLNMLVALPGGNVAMQMRQDTLLGI